MAAAVFSEWTRFKKHDSAETFLPASQHSQKKGGRNAQYARVSCLPSPRVEGLLMFIQYKAFDTPVFRSSGQHSLPQLHYGRLKHLISVVFSEGFEDLRLQKGETVVFASFHQCMLSVNGPRLDRLNIYFYSGEDESLQTTEISHIHGLVGRIRDGNSWAIVDQSGHFSQEAYLTHEAGQGVTGVT